MWPAFHIVVVPPTLTCVDTLLGSNKLFQATGSVLVDGDHFLTVAAKAQMVCRLQYSENPFAHCYSTALFPASNSYPYHVSKWAIP